MLVIGDAGRVEVRETSRAYLDEFVFRRNRRGTPMADFQTLLDLGLMQDPITYRDIIDRAA